MNVESSPHRRGINAGIMQNVFAALIGTTAAGILLPLLSEAFGWRMTFFLTGVPGLICALLVWLYLREPAGDPAASTRAHHIGLGSALTMLTKHNIRICCVISIFMVAWFLVTLQFLVPFLEYRGFSSPEAGGMFSFMGYAAAVCGFLVPALSDRIGRKPAMILFCFMGMVGPLAALYLDGPIWAISLLLFVGWSGTGAFPIFMGVVPGETVPRALAASSMGLVVCIGELVGGVAMPWIAGGLADRTTLAATMYVAAACAACGGVTALFLRETAPRKVGTPALDVAGAGTTAP